jgi:hypothetical protein
MPSPQGRFATHNSPQQIVHYDIAKRDTLEGLSALIGSVMFHAHIKIGDFLIGCQ